MRPAGRALLFAAVTALLPAAARAGGYDTPMLYSARHMGMGGTAIGYVDDPSAMFHNPAGLAHTRKLSLIGDVSLLLAKVRSSPTPFNKDIWSEQTVAPLGLVGGGLRVHEIVTVGLGIYPIALAGATYKYPGPGRTDENVENRTRLIFFEASPAVAINLPWRLRLGAGYRITYVNLQRYQGDPAVTDMLQLLDFTVSGFNFLGFRVGAQWTPLDWLQVGAVYRHKTETKVTNDSGVALGMRFTDLETTFVLPAKAGLGARADVWYFGLAVDGEYLFNDQNDAYPLIGLPDPPPANGMRFEVPNIFNWENEIVVRAGVEFRFGMVPALERMVVRAGYVYDGQTTVARYPSAFGTPPGPTHVVTGGLGWNGGNWQVNAAFARRWGTGDVTEAGLAPAGQCQFCGYAGEQPYRIGVNGFYLDFSYSL